MMDRKERMLEKGSVAVLDATPVDLTSAYVVSVEGKSLDRFFTHQQSSLAYSVLEMFLESLDYTNDVEIVQVWHHDLSLIMATTEEAIVLADALNGVLPPGSERWTEISEIPPGVNAYVQEYDLNQFGDPSEPQEWRYAHGAFNAL